MLRNLRIAACLGPNSNWLTFSLLVVAAGLMLLAASMLLSCGTKPDPVATASTSQTANSPDSSPSPPTATHHAAIPSAILTAPETTAPTLTSTSTAGPADTPAWTSTAVPPSPTASPTPAVSPTPAATPTPVPIVAVPEDVVNILAIGVDSARNLKSQNTDTIMVVSINKATRQVSMLSIPRDLWVHIPTYGWNRINQAHKWGHTIDYPGNGPGLLMRTLEVNLGIPLHHWVRLDFQGFTRVVDELGGVEMTVACPVNLRYRAPEPGDPNQEERILEAGVHHMDGDTALRYVRTRRDGTDFDRARRQQQFLRVLWAQSKSPEIIPRIPELWSALADAFRTDLTLSDVLSMVPVALEVKPQRVRSLHIGFRETTNWVTDAGSKVLLPDQDKIQQLVASLYTPSSAVADQAADEAARIQVRNGTYRHQLAKIGADQLRWRGLTVVDTGLADHPNYKQTRLIVFQDKPKAQALLTQYLGLKPEDIVQQPDANQPADLLLILGEDYDPCGR